MKSTIKITKDKNGNLIVDTKLGAYTLPLPSKNKKGATLKYLIFFLILHSIDFPIYNKVWNYLFLSRYKKIKTNEKG